MPQPHQPEIRLAPEDEKGPWGPKLREAAARSLALAEERLGLELDAAPLVESAVERDFYRELGEKPHHLVAVAIAGENRTLINRTRFFEADPGERDRTLVHEFSHLVVGRRVPGGVPRWLDEGLAMAVSREAGFGYHSRLALAATFGGLVPLDAMWGDPGTQELAYAQSLSATRFLIQTFGHARNTEDENLAALAQTLSDPDAGKSLRALLHDPIYLRAFEAKWQDSIQTPWTWIAALTGGGVLWGAITALFLVVYWRKRRMAQAKAKTWEEEEDFPYDEEAFHKLEDNLEEGFAEDFEEEAEENPGEAFWAMARKKTKRKIPKVGEDE